MLRTETIAVTVRSDATNDVPVDELWIADPSCNTQVTVDREVAENPYRLEATWKADETGYAGVGLGWGLDGCDTSDFDWECETWSESSYHVDVTTAQDDAGTGLDASDVAHRPTNLGVEPGDWSGAVEELSTSDSDDWYEFQLPPGELGIHLAGDCDLGYSTDVYLEVFIRDDFFSPRQFIRDSETCDEFVSDQILPRTSEVLVHIGLDDRDDDGDGDGGTAYDVYIDFEENTALSLAEELEQRVGDAPEDGREFIEDELLPLVPCAHDAALCPALLCPTLEDAFDACRVHPFEILDDQLPSP